MNGKAPICCFTGHRRLEPERMQRLYEELSRTLDVLLAQGVTHYRTGGAMGFDTLAALAILDRKPAYPGIFLELCLPCRDQTKKWNDRDRAIYDDILSRADRAVVLYEHYTPGCMHERNRYMVNGSRYCIAYCTTDTGGTAYTVRYATQKGVTVLNLANRF
ncbi:MAG: DUF1273 family protein [Clostridia bacterium]|nr:DUF1273 family protein [Clostridia bacterium]